MFAGYDYLDSVIVVSSVTGRFKAYIRNPPKEQEGDIEEDMCIFNDDYQTLTTEWLRELNIDTYLWDSVRNRAVIVDGMDSIYAYRGGCEHYNIVVQRVLSSENPALTDSPIG